MLNPANYLKVMDKAHDRGVYLVLGTAVVGLLAGCGQTTPRFEAEAKGNAITLYSTSSATDQCYVQVMFTYVQDGVRKTAGHYCNGCLVPVGKHVKVSDISDAIIVDPRIESVKSVCDIEHNGKPSWVK